MLAAIGVSAGVALLITLVRFLGEYQGWYPAVFHTESGGGLSPLGITWLVPLFGFWFGRKLAHNGYRPGAPGRAVLLHVVGIAALVAVFAVAFRVVETWTTRGIVVNAGAVACSLFALAAWGRAYFVNLTAGILARIPVIVVQFVAIQRGLDMHFAKGPPGSPEQDALFLLTLAQVGMWPFGFCTLVGGLFSVLGACTVRR